MPKPWQVGQTAEQESVQAQQRAILRRDATEAGADYEEANKISGWNYKDYEACRMLPEFTGKGSSTFGTGTYLRRGGNADIDEVQTSMPKVKDE